MTKKTKIIKNTIVAAITAFSVACSTTVHITSDPPGAMVYLDGQKIGKTPVEKNLDNFIGKKYNVVLKMPGYQTIDTSMEREVKVGPLIVGLMVTIIPLLWAYGPRKTQHYVLTKNDAAQKKTKLINRFAKGIILLDGQAVSMGETIVSSGKHLLSVLYNGQKTEQTEVWLNPGMAYEMK